MVVAGAAAAQRKPTQSWSAYDYFLRGRSLANAHKETEAEPFFAQAAAIDPDFVQAHAWRAVVVVVNYWFTSDRKRLEVARASAVKAIALDNTDPTAHHAMAMVALYGHDLQRAQFHFDRAYALNPLDASICGDRAVWLCQAGRLEEGLKAIDEAIQRDAFAPIWLWGVRGRILFHMQRYQEAADTLGNLEMGSDYIPMYRAAALGMLGDIADAKREVARLSSALAGSRISSLTSWLPFADPGQLEQLQDGLRRAGVPEEANA